MLPHVPTLLVLGVLLSTANTQTNGNCKTQVLALFQYHASRRMPRVRYLIPGIDVGTSFYGSDCQPNGRTRPDLGSGLSSRSADTYIKFQSIETPPRGGRITIQDSCQEQQRGLAVGAVITACNLDLQGEAPDIAEVNPGQLSPVDVICPDQCPQASKVQILEYCA